MALGTLRWFSSPLGYGFIERDDGQTVYVHYTDLHPFEPQQAVHAGERVEFEIHESPRGPQATHVNRV
jgi:CspA family cold shock protein